MAFYRLENGEPVRANHRYIKYDGMIYANPTDEVYRMAGYKTLIESEIPEIKDGFDIVKSYEETDNSIIVHYTYAEIEAADEEETADTEVTEE